MNTDLSIFTLVKEASFVVQFVMFILLAASLASWTFIFSKRKELKQAIGITDDFAASRLKTATHAGSPMPIQKARKYSSRPIWFFWHLGR